MYIERRAKYKETMDNRLQSWAYKKKTENIKVLHIEDGRGIQVERFISRINSVGRKSKWELVVNKSKEIDNIMCLKTVYIIISNNFRELISLDR